MACGCKRTSVKSDQVLTNNTTEKVVINTPEYSNNDLKSVSNFKQYNLVLKVGLLIGLLILSPILLLAFMSLIVKGSVMNKSLDLVSPFRMVINAINKRNQDNDEEVEPIKEDDYSLSNVVVVKNFELDEVNSFN